MIPANEHHCPVCGGATIPIWRAMCKGCFSLVPWKLRADLLHAYRNRVLDHRGYQELLIEARHWFVDQNAFLGEGNNGV